MQMRTGAVVVPMRAMGWRMEEGRAVDKKRGEALGGLLLRAPPLVLCTNLTLKKAGRFAQILRIHRGVIVRFKRVRSLLLA